ncbi:MAG: YcfL family protein [Clostridia bacterium]|nr:YcfL family protein [Clostridia bacterium]
MKSKEKRMLVTIAIIGIIIIASLLIWKSTNTKEELQPEKEEQQNTITEKYVTVLENGMKLNKSDKLNQTRSLNGIEISEIQLTYQDGQSVILATVRNTTNNDIDLTPVKITLYDDQNNILEEINGLISPVKKGESVQLNMGVGTDYANAYDLKIEII